MAYSKVVIPGDGVTTLVPVNFAIGVEPGTVTCRVGNEVDGGGDPTYRTFTWVSSGMVQVNGAPAAIGQNYVFVRTVDKEELIVDWEDGEAITKNNLNTAQKQAIMIAHEALDKASQGIYVSPDKDGIEYTGSQTPNAVLAFSADGETVIDGPTIGDISNAAEYANTANAASIAAVNASIAAVNAAAIAVGEATVYKKVFISPHSFGGIGDGVADDTAAFKSAAIEAMATNSILNLGSKTWRVKDGQWPGYSGPEQRTVVLVTGDLVVVGDNARILFDGNNVNEYATIFRSIGGGRLFRYGVSLDYAKLPFTQGVCLSKTANTARFTIDVVSCGVPTWGTVERMCQYNIEPETGEFCYKSTIFEANGGARTMTLVSANTYDINFAADIAALANVTVGQTYVLYHKVNGYYFSDVTDGSLFSYNCWTRAVAGMSDSGSYVKDFVIIGGGVRQPFNSGRIITTTSDGVAHVNGCSGRFDVQPDWVEGTSDDAANLNCPFNSVSAINSANSFTVSVVPPARMFVVGEKLWGIAPDGSPQNMGNVASVVGNVVTMASNLFAGFAAMTGGLFNTGTAVGSDKYITKNAIYWPRMVKRAAGGGAVIRGFNPTIRGTYMDINGPAYSMICFWSLYNEGPVSKHVDVDITVIRAGRGREAVTGVIRLDAVRRDTGAASPAGTIVGGRVRMKVSDCRVGALWMTSCDSVEIEIDDVNTNYDPWAIGGVPQPTANCYLQNCNNILFTENHLGSGNALAYFQDCVRINTAGCKNVVFFGTGNINVKQNFIVAAGGGGADDGGEIGFRTNSTPIETGPMSRIKGTLENIASGTEAQGGIILSTRPVGAAGQALLERLRVFSNGLVRVTGHAWNGAHLQMGSYHLWGDANGDMRFKNAAPSSDVDGQAVVGKVQAPVVSTTPNGGNLNQISWDSTYIYVPIGPTTWRRVAHSAY